MYKAEIQAAFGLNAEGTSTKEQLVDAASKATAQPESMHLRFGWNQCKFPVIIGAIQEIKDNRAVQGNEGRIYAFWSSTQRVRSACAHHLCRLLCSGFLRALVLSPACSAHALLFCNLQSPHRQWTAPSVSASCR
jgi:hypothetical protein